MKKQQKFQKKIRDIQGQHHKSLNKWWQRFVNSWRFVNVWQNDYGEKFLYLCDQDTGIKFASARLMKKKIQRTDLGFLYGPDEF